ncbi:MAG: nucleotidyltransferase family protein [Bdellovibrionales bacterium]|nr:nucleotidyltransferase family protein [Bdellovibrionales bacterium]NQZ18075.1 nucleotidyltransferase family protein [Bdellovibrionales bacterium]
MTTMTTALPSLDMKGLWNKDFLERHHLLGHVYRRTQEKDYYPYWKSQLTRNFVVKSELEKIGEDMANEGVTVCLLKGYSLMGDVYEDWGERFASDVDLLVSINNLSKLSDTLKMYGYERRTEKKWLGNRHKYVFEKKVGDSSIVVEVHTQLFWHKALESEVDLKESQVKGFKLLSPENQLIHLCGHLAFQHTYLKLFWLMDIFKFVEQSKDKIDWKLFWQQAQASRLYKSCYFTLFLCQKLGLNIQPIVYMAPKKSRISMFVLKKLVDFQFLYDPRRYPVRFVLVKNLIKDSFFDNIRYWYAWMRKPKSQ